MMCTSVGTGLNTFLIMAVESSGASPGPQSCARRCRCAPRIASGRICKNARHGWHDDERAAEGRAGCPLAQSGLSAELGSPWRFRWLSDPRGDRKQPRQAHHGLEVPIARGGARCVLGPPRVARQPQAVSGCALCWEYPAETTQTRLGAKKIKQNAFLRIRRYFADIELL